MWHFLADKTADISLQNISCQTSFAITLVGKQTRLHRYVSHGGWVFVGYSAGKPERACHETRETVVGGTCGDAVMPRLAH